MDDSRALVASIIIFLAGVALILAFFIGYKVGIETENPAEDFARVTITGIVTGIQNIDGENHVTLDTFVGGVVILPTNINPEIGKKYSFNYYKGAELYMSKVGIRVLAEVELEEIR